MKTSYITRSVRRFAGAAALSFVAIASACSGDLLEVEDPDVLNPDQLNSPSAATALRNGTRTRFTTVMSGQNSDNLVMFGGLLADEWRSGDTFEQRNTMDQRTAVPQNTFISPIFRDVNRIRTAAEQAISATRDYDPTNVATGVSEQWALRAMAATLAGEHFCNGIPFSRLAGTIIEYGNPVSVDSAFGLAVAEADSALATPGLVLTGTQAQLARVVKARSLLNRGQYAAAAAAIGGNSTAGVPTAFVYQTFHSSVTEDNAIWSLNTNIKRYVVSPAEGTNGLNFRGATDPRVPSTATGNAFDTSTPFFGQSKWARFDAVTVASGLEARLIEAEAQWQTDMTTAGNRTTVTGLLNALRAAPPAGSTTGALAPLAVPADANAMTDLLFRERAFWMYSTGHRLGDLRRLVRQYGRGVETVYPTGAYHKGGTYGSLAVIQVPFDELNNPNYTGCTNLDP